MHITKLRKKLTESNVIIESIRGIGYKLKWKKSISFIMQL
jgi:DNA-binding response OmpR family regulator